MPVPFLLEIGCEEIPDWMIVPALKNLQELLEKVISEHNLSGQVAWTDATPRRLVIYVEGLNSRQEDSEEMVMGPPKSAGPGAVTGFAKKMGVDQSALKILKSGKGEYYSIVKAVVGRETKAILAEALPGVISKIYFPKTMYWTGKNGFRFIRPIRWLVALLGEELVEFELAGVKSGNVTRGHRKLGSSAIPVTIDNYREELKKNFVLIMASERRAKIRAEIKKSGVQIKPDPALLDTLVYITEYPAVITGDFDRQFLELPEEVLVTVMRHHQKYFSVEDSHGNLAPSFVAVMNTAKDPDGLVRKGNESVLRSRFNDARFFYRNDQQKKLVDRVMDLDKVTFQAKLGTYLEKTHRVVDLVQELGGGKEAERAALLAKCDLTTEMVKEFTDLQGIVGGLYARAQGEHELVWRAIYEHYKPLSMEDSIPSTQEGRILAIADKLDTLRGYFEIGLTPSGSKDPFALRRAAQGVVKILVEGEMKLPMPTLFGGNEALREFMLERVRHYFKEVRGFQYDEVNAVLKAGSDDLVDVAARLEAVQAVRPTADFEPLAAAFKRIQNILKQSGVQPGASPSPVQQTLLEPGAERELYDRFQVLRDEIGSSDYKSALEAIASIRPQVDHFFDKVMVNAPDEAVRANRLTLLSSLLVEFSTIADFSEIVTQ
jgi:glycyl-tRNA synthetase beta chain